MKNAERRRGIGFMTRAACLAVPASAVLPGVAHAMPHVWQDHRGWVLIVACGFAVFGLLVVALLANVRKLRQVELRLRDSEAGFRRMAELTHDWEYWVAPDGTFRFITPSCERVTGYTREEFLSGHGLRSEMVLPEDREAWDAHCREEPEGSRIRSIQFRIRRKDGTLRWIEHTCIPVRDEQGAFLGYRAGNRDITERRKEEESLARYRENLEKLVAERTEELEEEVVRRTRNEQELEMYRRNLERLVRERTRELEDEIARRKSAQEALALSEANLRRAQEVAMIGGWSLDLVTGGLSWTDGVYELFGLDPGTPLDYAAFLSMVHPDDAELVNKNWNNALHGAQYDIEHRIVVNGAVKWVREKAQVEFSESGKALKGSGIVQDITRRRQAEEQQESLRRQLAHVSRVGVLGELTAALAHEINQPLAAILANAQAALHMIRDPKPDIGEVGEILGDIIHDDKRAREVISRVRSLLKKEAPKMEPTDVNQVARDAVRMVERECLLKGISVRTELAEALPPVSGDRIRLGQVVINLLVNAVDALAEGSGATRIITVQSGMDSGRGVTLSVRDTGRGVGADAVRRIFEPFYTTKGQGLGLGLSISRTIVEAHGGRLWASDSPEGGAVFSLSLPIMTGVDRDEQGHGSGNSDR